MRTLSTPEACVLMMGNAPGGSLPLFRWETEEPECFEATGLWERQTPVAENWQNTVPALLAEFTKTVQSQRDSIRIAGLEREVLMLRSQMNALQQSAATSVTIDTMAPEPVEVIRPFHVVVEPYEDEFKASFYDANLSAFGDTRNEAIWNLKDLLAATFEMLTEHDPDRLGPGPARELEVLQQFLKRIA
jgi:hypothetical protein